MQTFIPGERVIFICGGKYNNQHGTVTGPSMIQYPGYFRRYKVRLDIGLSAVIFSNNLKPEKKESIVEQLRQLYRQSIAGGEKDD
ncbi:MAG: hypothetical protein IKF90_07275 [Parasporobacterium sp.]|nr:hypothetical protein [Parasporobacterium sp.]